jgi:hypothetical protein
LRWGREDKRQAQDIAIERDTRLEVIHRNEQVPDPGIREIRVFHEAPIDQR